MNCDNALEQLETGSFWQRLQARRHVHQCAKCGEAIRTLETLKSELADHPRLTAYQRRLWEQAAVEASAAGRSAGQAMLLAAHFRFAIAASLVALLVSTIIVFPKFYPPATQPERVVQTSTLTRNIDTSAELSDLASKLSELEVEVASLSQHAELIDAREQIITLIATYSKW